MIRPILAFIFIFLPACSAMAQTASPDGRTAAKRLEGVKTWGYQLQKADPAEIAASPFDLVVIDYSRNGTDGGRYTPAEVKAMQRKPDGSRRYVLAYLSIGEAETYRYYWDKKWIETAPLMRSRVSQNAAKTNAGQSNVVTVRIPRLIAPSWLGRENAGWPGNFLIRYWYDGWQNLIMHHDGSYLSRILDAGFDGVYLDRVDAFYETKLDREFATRKMAEFVIELAQIARQTKSDFIVVPQNAEELLEIPRYVAAIDGFAKEDFLYGLPKEGEPNSLQRIATTTARLRIASAAGLPVLIAEYLDRPELVRTAEVVLRSFGFIPYFAPRKLDRLVVPSPSQE